MDAHVLVDLVSKIKQYLPEQLASPAIVGVIVTICIYVINTKRDRRKLSLDLYKEFYTEDFAKMRYNAEAFFASHLDIDWTKTDPYTLHDPENLLSGYSAVNRYFTRLSILYKEKQLDRRLIEKLLSQMGGYWYGLIFEKMIARHDLYTRHTIFYIFDRLRNGSASKDFENGYGSGSRWHARKRSAPPQLWSRQKP